MVQLDKLVVGRKLLENCLIVILISMIAACSVFPLIMYTYTPCIQLCVLDNDFPLRDFNCLNISPSYRIVTTIATLCGTPLIQAFIGKLCMIAVINRGSCLCRDSND